MRRKIIDANIKFKLVTIIAIYKVIFIKKIVYKKNTLTKYIGSRVSAAEFCTTKFRRNSVQRISGGLLWSFSISPELSYVKFCKIRIPTELWTLKLEEIGVIYGYV